MTEMGLVPLNGAIFHSGAQTRINIKDERYCRLFEEAYEYDFPVAFLTLEKKDFLKIFHPEDIPVTEGMILPYGKVLKICKQETQELSIKMQGIGKVKLMEKVIQEPYLIFRGEQVEQESQIRPENLFKLNRIKKFACDWAEKEYQIKSHKNALDIQIDPLFLDLMAGVVAKGLGDQLKIVNENDINKKVEKLIDKL